jgi:glycosyltransferase involved in cell wall biosynthesis
MILHDSNKKNLLIITVYFPPIISTASNRLLAFAKYFNKNKFNITVVCPDDGLKGDPEFSIENVSILRIKSKKHPLKITFSKNDSFVIHKLKAAYNMVFNQFIRDEYKFWTESATLAVKNVFKKNDIDFVISSFPTVAPHLVALKLIKSEYKFKWIADMRDGMSLNPFNLPFQKQFLKDIESKIFQTAWHITTTTPSLVKSFKLLSGSNSHKIFEIRNGFDFDIPEAYNYNEIFTICHAGTFYADIKPFRFLEAISELLEEKKLSEIKINFIGAGNAVQLPNELKNVVVVTPKIPHERAKEQIINSDTLLLLAPKSITEYLPGKLYEYIASQKPVIVLTSKGSEAELLVRSCHSGFIAEENDIAGTKGAILDAYNLWKTKSRLKVNNEYLSQFHRKNQVKKLENLMLTETREF